MVGHLHNLVGSVPMDLPRDTEITYFDGLRFRQKDVLGLQIAMDELYIFMSLLPELTLAIASTISIRYCRQFISGILPLVLISFSRVPPSQNSSII